MGFVNEINDQDRSRQTIDRERNFVLKEIRGPMPESPHEFSLILDGEEIFFSAFMKHNQKKKEELAPGEKPYRPEWCVVSIAGALHLTSNKAYLYPLIEEALDAYGTTGNPSRKHIESVTVIFSPNLLKN